MNYDLTEGNIMKNLLKFAFPIILGNMLQQLYNGSRHADCRTVPRGGRAGGSRFVLYADGVCNLDNIRPLHGQQCLFFHAVWQARL